MFNLRRNKKGFTMIELIVVIAIIAILAAIAIPSFIGITENANAKVNLANARNIATGINAYNALHPNETQITSTTGCQATLTTANLWPEGLTDTDDIAAALAMISFSTNGAAIASETTETTTEG